MNNFVIILFTSDCKINQRENRLQTNWVDLTLDVPQRLYTLYLNVFLAGKFQQNCRAWMKRGFFTNWRSCVLQQTLVSPLSPNRVEDHPNIFTFFKSGERAKLNFSAHPLASTCRNYIFSSSRHQSGNFHLGGNKNKFSSFFSFLTSLRSFYLGCILISQKLFLLQPKECPAGMADSDPVVRVVAGLLTTDWALASHLIMAEVRNILNSDIR